MPTSPPVISFIIIARNQRRTIERSIEGAMHAAVKAELTSYEIIYVDSRSTDGSADLVRSRFGHHVAVVSLDGVDPINAGIARNAGARSATGKALFFIDGDMEIDPAFLTQALDAKHELVHPLVVGQLPECFYDADWHFLARSPDRYHIGSRHFRAEIGGVMLVSRAAFESLSGFKPELRINEDLDFGLRMAAKGMPALALPTPIALHHTIDYLDWSRLLHAIRDGSMLYPGVLFRRHLTNRHYWPIVLSHQRATLVLLGSLVLAWCWSPAWLLLFPAYAVLKSLRQRHVSLLQSLVGITARSLQFILGALFFHPRAPRSVSIPQPPES